MTAYPRTPPVIPSGARNAASSVIPSGARSAESRDLHPRQAFVGPVCQLGTPVVLSTGYGSAFPIYSTVLLSVPMGSIVISTRSPRRSVNSSGGMIPVPVSRMHPAGKLVSR
jgi:hypothetical protein